MWETLQQEVHGCTRCELRTTELPLIDLVAPQVAPIVFVAERADWDSCVVGEPLQDKAGTFFLSLARDTIARDMFRISYLVRCSGTGKTLPRCVYDRCKPWLWRELQLTQPSVVVTLGKVASATMLRRSDVVLKDCAGYPVSVEYMDAPIIPWYALSAIFESSGKLGRQTKKFLERLASDYIQQEGANSGE